MALRSFNITVLVKHHLRSTEHYGVLNPLQSSCGHPTLWCSMGTIRNRGRCWFCDLTALASHKPIFIRTIFLFNWILISPPRSDFRCSTSASCFHPLLLSPTHFAPISTHLFTRTAIHIVCSHFGFFCSPTLAFIFDMSALCFRTSHLNAALGLCYLSAAYQSWMSCSHLCLYYPLRLHSYRLHPHSPSTRGLGQYISSSSIRL